MYSTYDDRRRGGRDIPPSSSSRYYDSLYAQPSRSVPRHAPVPEAAEPDHHHRRHRRKSVGDEALGGRPSHRKSKATVVPSDDGVGYGGAAAYPEAPTSRHDVEAKTGDGHKRFRDKRGGYETDEAQHMRSKSYSPRGAEREVDQHRHASPQVPPKSAWADDAQHAPENDLHRSATTGSKKSRHTPQYYDEDAALRSRHSKSRDYGAAGHDYTTATGMPRPPMGDYSPYAASPHSSSRGSDEKVGKKHHRETPYHGTGYGQPEADPAEPPRHSRHHRPAEDRAAAAAAYHDDRHAAQPPPARGEPRGRHRQAPPPESLDDPYAAAAAAPPKPHPPRARHQRAPPPADNPYDPYDRAPPPRARQRQSMPPQGRSRYADGYESDAYGAGGPPPHRRAKSVNHREPRHAGGGDERAPRGGGSPALDPAATAGMTSSQKKAAHKAAKAEKGKKIGKQAGKMFMTHAFPVIKQEAVPFLTKAAQAYFEQQKK